MGRNSKIFSYICLIVAFSLILIAMVITNNNQDTIMIYAQSIKDPHLKITTEYQNLSRPTGMAFLDDSGKNILIIEKKGDVKLISNGTLQNQPIQHFDVNFEVERGLLGIETMQEDNSTSIFLYMTVNSTSFPKNSSETVRNQVYSFEWNGSNLTNQKLLLDLPGTPGPEHNGGKITLGKDNYLYVIIGDLLLHKTKLQNVIDGGDPDFTGSIYRIDPKDGSAPPDNPFLNSTLPNLTKTYAYGIRNSFGLTVDPVTGTLWDTENGANVSDEINLVTPGFNSGWESIMGPSKSAEEIKGLVYLSSNASYSEPEMSWTDTQAPTDIEFINGSNLGEDYTNNLLVGDHNNGNLYFFKLNSDRSGLESKDKVIDTEAEYDKYVLGTGFRSISDIETGPDGNVYVVSLQSGKIFKISPGVTSGWIAS